MFYFPTLEEESVLDLEAGFYHAVFESSSDCVKVLSIDGAIQSMNAFSRALLGTDHLGDLHGTPWRSLWDAGSHAAMERALRAARAGQTGRFAGIRSRGRSKSRSWEAQVRPIFDGQGRVRALVAVSRDMTAAREAEALSRQAAAALEVAAEANAKLRAFFEQGANFAALTRCDGAVLEVNRAAVALAAFDMDELIGRKFWECGWWNRSVDVSEKVKAGIALAASGGRFREELRYAAADSVDRVVDLTLAPVMNSSGLVLFVAAKGVDITERKVAAEKLRQVSADFAEADRRKTEFLVTLAHELRNPLAPISNGLDAMRLSSDRPDVVARARAMMARQVGQLSHLVDDLLDIARISNGKVDLKRMKVDLAGILAVSVETSTPLIEANGHALTLDVSVDAMPLFADPTRIIQAVSNLLNNAAKYTHPGGAIVLSAMHDGDDAVIAVADNGVGIAEAQIEDVFVMFSQVGKSIERSQGGLGIGLSLVRQLVELHGGSVSARSPGPDAGSVFTIRLPLALADQKPAQGPVVEVAPADQGNLRILIADDNLDAAEAMSDLLSMLGHDCSMVADGVKAVESAKAIHPDAIFLDIGMPGLNGYEAAMAIRGAEGAERAVLIALTGWGGADERAKSAGAGFDHHITKPASLDTLNVILTSIAAAKSRTATWG
jgi:PAS domain S-box-containing protein